MTYLLIQNDGESPVEGYTQLGFSSSRGRDGTIGQFGTGAKHGINLCLRHGLEVWVYCGTTRVEFQTRTELVKDGTSTNGMPNYTKVEKVVYRVGNSTTFKDSGWVLAFGSLDWPNVGMGLREFISNALDRTARSEGGEKNMAVEMVDAKARRAKAGTTRIFVEVNDDVLAYFEQLNKRFLQFSDTPNLPGVLPKADRNISGKGAVIYREGVFIRELAGESLFDYNFSSSQLKIDECRNSNEWEIRSACAHLVKNAEAAVLAAIIQAQLDGREVYESHLDADYLTNFGRLNDEQKHRWKEAWESTAGPDAVVCDNEFAKDYVARKGQKARIVPSSWSDALSKAGIKSSTDVLRNDHDQGNEVLAATPYAIAAIAWAWELFEMGHLVGEKEKPNVFCFQEILKAEARLECYTTREGIGLHVDISNSGLNNVLKKAALTGVATWITGATETSLDVRSIILDTLVALA